MVELLQTLAPMLNFCFIREIGVFIKELAVEKSATLYCVSSPEVVLSLYLFSSFPESGCSVTPAFDGKGITRSFALLGHLTGECDSVTATPLPNPPLLAF